MAGKTPGDRRERPLPRPPPSRSWPRPQHGSVQLLLQARGVVARLLGGTAGGVEVRPGLVGLLARLLGGGERGLQPLGRAFGGLLRAVELALAGAALGAGLA